MQRKKDVSVARQQATLIARFGRKRLVRQASGVGTLVGDKNSEPTEVKEWIALFGQDIVLASSQ
ncbi:MAG: hypothetical protein ACI9VS_003930 [Candidatus Binatia bacterium]|jgi:hypothetical protein